MPPRLGEKISSAPDGVRVVLHGFRIARTPFGAHYLIMTVDLTPYLLHILVMNIANVKTDLKNIADHLPETASYADAMYELYVRMKVAAGHKAVSEGRVHSHEAVKSRFTR